MKKLITTLVALTLSLGAMAVVVDRSTPEKTLQSFIACLQAQDLKAAITCVKGGVYNLNMKYAEPALKKTSFSCKLTNLSVTIAGDRAKAETTIEATISNSKLTCSETVSLVLVGKDWLLHNPDGKMDRDSVINSFVLSCTESDSPSNGDIKGTPMQVCEHRIKQVAIGIVMFEADEGKLAFTSKNWTQKIEPYAMPKSMLTCPLDKPGVISYTVNPAVCGKSLTSMKAAAKTVLIYEGKNGKLIFRHEGKASVAFADGHVEQVTPAQAKTLRWKP